MGDVEGGLHRRGLRAGSGGGAEAARGPLLYQPDRDVPHHSAQGPGVLQLRCDRSGKLHNEGKRRLVYLRGPAAAAAQGACGPAIHPPSPSWGCFPSPLPTPSSQGHSERACTCPPPGHETKLPLLGLLHIPHAQDCGAVPENRACDPHEQVVHTGRAVQVRGHLPGHRGEH